MTRSLTLKYKHMKKNRFMFQIVSVLIAYLLIVTSCSKYQYNEMTSADVNITGYLDRSPDSFSLFREIIDLTGTASFLNAYGAYTCFVVTNDGVKFWMDSVGIKSLAEADINTLKNLVRFHLLNDTLTTGNFTDGKLQTPTMYGQYLITGANYVNGISSYTINRQASIIKTNVQVGNGIIHVIDHMLIPASKSLAQSIEDNPDYSIFVEALKETGFYDTLNILTGDSITMWRTVIAESNQALSDSGFYSFAELKAKYSNTGNPKNPKDSLNMYVAYHIINGLYYLGDIINYSTMLTLMPEEVISIKLSNQDIILNEGEFNGVVEKGVKLNRSKSDNSATNGVWHSDEAHTMAKLRAPMPLYWDVCTFPEILNQPGYYKKQTLIFSRATADVYPIASINWEWKTASNFVKYTYGSSSTIGVNAINADLLEFPFGSPNRSSWIEFTTPVVIKGRYKVWICYSAVNVVTVNVKVNGKLMTRPVNFGEFRPAGTPAELESIGWKAYTRDSLAWRANARLIGIVDIPTTGSQVVRFESVSGTNASSYLDMIQFIPIDDEQLLPRFNVDGSQYRY